MSSQGWLFHCSNGMDYHFHSRRISFISGRGLCFLIGGHCLKLCPVSQRQEHRFLQNRYTGTRSGILEVLYPLGWRYGECLVFVLMVIPMENDNSMHLVRAEVPGPTAGKLVPRMRTDIHDSLWNLCSNDIDFSCNFEMPWYEGV